MKNITINLIGQSVLEEVLRENLKHINFEIKPFNKFDEIIQDSKVKNSSILIASLKDFNIQAEHINKPVGVWVNGKKISSIGVRISNSYRHAI